LNDDTKYWLFVFSFSYGVTISVECILRQFWFYKSEELTNLALFQLFFSIFLLPFILVTTNYYITKKLSKRNLFPFTAVIICSCIYLAAKIGFLNWADSVGSRIHPDNETLMVVALEWQTGILIALIGLTICFIRLYRKKK